MTRLLLMLCLLPMAASAGSPAWNCRNPHFEAGCSGGQCTAAPPGDFTPMDIAFTEDGSLSACMYSGCWEGNGQAGGEYITLSHTNPLAPANEAGAARCAPIPADWRVHADRSTLLHFLPRFRIFTKNQR